MSRFNHADAAVHQAVTHLGSTHLLMEGVVVATNRCLSPSHPVFKVKVIPFMRFVIVDYTSTRLTKKCNIYKFFK